MRWFNMLGASLAIIGGGLPMTPDAQAQRYLVNGHPATLGEEQILASHGFNAGAWRMDGWGISQDVAHTDFVPGRRLSQCRFVLDVPLDCDMLLIAAR